MTLSSDNDAEKNEARPLQNKYAPTEQNEDVPMDLGDLQDIFSFSFMRGRPILNFILAILWSIGLPILLYHLLKGRIGQILAMVVASAPPLAIAIVRMVKDRQFDPLGFVAGTSFLISGIISIAEPDEKVASICESITPLMVGVFCLVSLIPIRLGAFELRPIIYQLANQVMPREEYDETLQEQDDRRLATPKSKRQKLDFLYTSMARFRRDMRIMTAAWGCTLIAGFVIKVIVVMTNADTGKAEIYGYIIFGLAPVAMSFFTFVYTKIVKSHVMDQAAFWKAKKQQQEQEETLDARTEGTHNLNWGVQSMSNTFSQVLGS